MRENDVINKEMFILLSGSVGVFQGFENEKPTQLATLGVGALFGEMSVFTSEPRSATIVTLSDVTAAAITKKDFLEFVKSSPDMAMGMIETLCTRLFALNQRVKQIEQK